MTLSPLSRVLNFPSFRMFNLTMRGLNLISFLSSSYVEKTSKMKGTPLPVIKYSTDIPTKTKQDTYHNVCEHAKVELPPASALLRKMFNGR